MSETPIRRWTMKVPSTRADMLVKADELALLAELRGSEAFAILARYWMRRAETMPSEIAVTLGGIPISNPTGGRMEEVYLPDTV